MRARRPRDHDDDDDEEQGQGQPHSSPLVTRARNSRRESPTERSKRINNVSGIGGASYLGSSLAMVAKTVTGKLKLQDAVANADPEIKNI